LETFRDYLRKVPSLPPSERAEIDDYIAQMEALKRKQASAARPDADAKPPGEGRPPRAGSPAEPPNLTPRPPEPNPALTASPPPPAERASGSRLWLWT